MPIIQPAIRPPAEAESFHLQVTLGCSANTCSFCGAYMNKPFRIRPFSEIEADIEAAASIRNRIRRVFLMDGDALVLDNQKMLPILHLLQASFPRLQRVSAYANDYNILSRTDQELAALYENRLRLIYMGLESGSQPILDACRKRSTVEGMVEAVTRASRAGIKSSLIVLLGLGGKAKTQAHVTGTITALNRMQPRYLSFLSLMLVPGTGLAEEAAAGAFQELDAGELLQEARDILAGLELEKTVFRSNHASNHLALEGRLPADRERLLGELDAALQGQRRLRPEFFRGL